MRNINQLNPQNEFKSLPFSEDSEKALLCSMLLSKECCDQVKIRTKSEHFYIPANCIIYDSILSLPPDSSPDWSVLLNAIGSRLEEIGGKQYLDGIFSFVPSASNWKSYQSILIDKFRLRQTIIACQRSIQSAEKEQNLDQALTELRPLFEQDEKIIFSQTAKETAYELIDIFERRQSGVERVVPVPWRILHDAVDGLRAGNLAVVSARRGGGKTSIACTWALHCLRSGLPVLYVSLEMKSWEIQERLVSQVARINGFSIKTNRLTNEQWIKVGRANAEVSKMPLHIIDSNQYDIAQLEVIAEQHKKQHDIRLVILENIQLVRPVYRGKNIRRDQELGDVAKRLKELSKRIDCPVLVFSQLNREGFTKDASEIEDHADLVLNLEPGDNKHEKVIFVSKNRNGIEQERYTLGFRGEFTELYE